MAPPRLFHYCSERAATDILAEEPPYFLVGTGSSYGWGMYATDMEPVDATTIDDVSTHCFAGQATAAEFSHVLLLHPANAVDRFEQTANPYEWMLLRDAPGAIIDLETLLFEARRLDGSAWTVIWP